MRWQLNIRPICWRVWVKKVNSQETIVNVISFIGLLSSVAGLVGWILPISNKNPRVLHAVYGFFIALLSASTVWYCDAYSRTKIVEKSANKLIESKGFHYTDEGFIQASLAFLEKNKDLYPDSYERAKLICQKNNCTPTHFSTETSHIASSFEGLIKGIGTLEAE